MFQLKVNILLLFVVLRWKLRPAAYFLSGTNLDTHLLTSNKQTKYYKVNLRSKQSDAELSETLCLFVASHTN